MPLSEFHTFPVFPAFTQDCQFGPTKLRYDMTFRERTKSWYLDIYELNGEPVMLGRRLSPRWIASLGYLDLMEKLEGVIYCMGKDTYRQEDLGEMLTVWHFPEADFVFVTTEAGVDTLEPTIVLS